MADFKNDPVLRTILVVFIGVIAFGFLFNLFTGGGTAMGGDHMGNMGASAGNGYGYGFSLGGLIGGLLFLLVKLLMVVLVVAVLIGIFVWLKNNFFQNQNSRFMQSINKDPILKTITIVTLAVIGIVLLFGLLNSFGMTGMGYGGHMGGYNYNSGFSFNPMYSISGLLTLLIKVLMFVLVVSLILAVVAYIKKQYDSGNLNLFSPAGNQGTGTATGSVNNQQIIDDKVD